MRVRWRDRSRVAAIFDRDLRAVEEELAAYRRWVARGRTGAAPLIARLAERNSDIDLAEIEAIAERARLLELVEARRRPYLN